MHLSELRVHLVNVAIKSNVTTVEKKIKCGTLTLFYHGYSSNGHHQTLLQSRRSLCLIISNLHQPFYYNNRYQKEMAIKFRDSVTFLSVDDKAKIPIGEPGQPIAAVSRGKRVSSLPQLLITTNTLPIHVQLLN